MEITRHAEVTWSGDLLTGSGTINYVSSGAFSRLPVTWASRTEDAQRPHLARGAHRRRARLVLLDGVLAPGWRKNGTPPRPSSTRRS